MTALVWSASTSSFFSWPETISFGLIIALAAGILEVFLRLIPTLRNVSLLSLLLELLQALAKIVPNKRAAPKGVFDK